MLKKFLEYGYYNKTSALIALLLGTIGEKINSYFVKISNDKRETNKGLPITYHLPFYNGNSEIVKRISNYLNENKHNAIVAAIVHGSISDYTTNNFSDFDGVIIYDQDELKTKLSIHKLRCIIKETHLMMLNFDALQHHSWMLLEKKDLANYNNTIFPSVIFENANTIYPSNLNSISISINDQYDSNIPFNNLTKSIEQKLILRSNLKYFYFYKNLVSEILLIPATFYQAIKKHPINKKDSFASAKQLFNNEKWEVIEYFENIRKSWDQSNINITEEIKALKYRSLKQYSISLRNPTPTKYLEMIDDKLIVDIKELIIEMKKQINNFN